VIYFEERILDELTQYERHVLKDNQPIPPQLIFKITCSEGEEELNRKFIAPAFSALAAGIFVSFSFFSEQFSIFIWQDRNVNL